MPSKKELQALNGDPTGPFCSDCGAHMEDWAESMKGTKPGDPPYSVRLEDDDACDQVSMEECYQYRLCEGCPVLLTREERK